MKVSFQRVLLHTIPDPSANFISANSQSYYFPLDSIIVHRPRHGHVIALLQFGGLSRSNPARRGQRKEGPWENMSTRRPLTMSSLARTLRLPANETQKNVVLVCCVLTMSVMSIALVWQAQIIANQREALQWLERLKFGL
jgi:hypothetical protein